MMNQIEATNPCLSAVAGGNGWNDFVEGVFCGAEFLSMVGAAKELAHYALNGGGCIGYAMHLTW